MNLTTSTQGFAMTPAICDAVRVQFLHAMRRLRPQVAAIDVHLSDLNGPKGGSDKHVVARIRLYDGRVFVLESTRDDLYSAIADSAKRARRTARRALARRRTRDRRALRAHRSTAFAQPATA